MKIVLKKRAINSIDKTAKWIESKNTMGSGKRWTNKILDYILKIAQSNASFQICRNWSLARYHYHCFHIDDWVVAFKKTPNTFTVYRFIHGSRLR